MTLTLFFSCTYAIYNLKNKNYFIIIVLELILNIYLIILIDYSIKNKNAINVTTKTNLINFLHNFEDISKHFTSEIFLPLDAFCRCVGLSVRCPALSIATLQFLSVLLAEEEKRRLQDKDRTNTCQAPTVALLLDGTQESLKSSERLNEAILQVCESLIFFFVCVFSRLYVSLKEFTFSSHHLKFFNQCLFFD